MHSHCAFKHNRTTITLSSILSEYLLKVTLLIRSIAVVLMASLLVSACRPVPILATHSMLHDFKDGIRTNEFQSSDLRITNQSGGCPSDAVPYKQWLVVLLLDSVEVRTSSYHLVSKLRLPSLTKEIEVREDGYGAVALLPQGLAYLRIHESGEIEFLDMIQHGEWEKVEFGDDFIGAWDVQEERLQLFEINSTNITLDLTMECTVFSIDMSCIITSGLHQRVFWNRSETDEPPVSSYIFSWYFPRWMELKGNLIAWWGWNDWFEPDLLIGDVSTIKTDGSFRILKSFYDLGGSTVAWGREILYLRTWSLTSPHPYSGFIALQVSDSNNITFIGRFDTPEFQRVVESTRRISYSVEGFVDIGCNYIDWWSIDDVEPALVSRIHYEGYVTDVAVAHDVEDSIVWPAFGFNVPPAKRTWGYPVVHKAFPPVIGDFKNLIQLNGKVFYSNRTEPIYMDSPRMVAYQSTLDHYRHPSFEMIGYNNSLYGLFWSGSSRMTLYRWSVNWTGMQIERTGLLSIDRWYILRDIADGIYYACSADSFFVINLETLDNSTIQVDFPSECQMMRVVNDLVIILAGAGFYFYKIHTSPFEPVSLEYLSATSFQADVFDVHEDILCAANSTHVTLFDIDERGGLYKVSSIMAPTLIYEYENHDMEDSEPGDLIIDSVTGCIYRAAGAFGFWILEPTKIAPVPTSITPADDSDSSVIIPFLGGFSFGVLIPSIIIAFLTTTQQFLKNRKRMIRLADPKYIEQTLIHQLRKEIENDEE